MDPLTIVSILSMLAAGVWSVWTWRAEHEEVRQLQRDQAAALYVNSYMVTIGELQRRLRGILESDDLAQARRDHPGPHVAASPFAVETLYELGLFFGWASVNFRFGPYTRDRVVIDCYRQMFRIFDGREGFPDAAFHFSLPEQASLGAAIMRRVSTLVGAESGRSGFPEFTHPEFAPITLHEFDADFRSVESSRAAFYRSPTIRRVVEAIDGASRGDRVRGHERLEALRPVLLRLGAHLQRKEGIVLATLEATAPSKGTTMVTGSSPAGAESPRTAGTVPPEVLYRMKGRIRLRVPRLKEDEAYAVGLGARIRKWEDVQEVNVDARAASLDVRYRPTAQEGEFRARVMDAIATTPHRDGRAGASRAHGAGPMPRRRRGAARGRSV